jgi:hypothetical protein
MMQFRSLVKAHWDKYLPEMVKEMKAEGTYEKLLNSEAQRMSEELAQMVRGGAQIAVQTRGSWHSMAVAVGAQMVNTFGPPTLAISRGVCVVETPLILLIDLDI